MDTKIAGCASRLTADLPDCCFLVAAAEFFHGFVFYDENIF